MPGWLSLPDQARDVLRSADGAEAHDFAEVLGRLDRALREQIQSRKIYMLAFGDQLPHWHLLLAAVSPAMADSGIRGAQLVSQRSAFLDAPRSRTVADAVAAAIRRPSGSRRGTKANRQPAPLNSETETKW